MSELFNTINITFNKELGGIEIRIPRGVELGEAEKAELKKMGFSWSKWSHLYWTNYSADKVEQMKNSFLKVASFPKPSEKTLAALEAKVAEKQKKAEQKASARKSERTSQAEVQAKMMEILLRMEAKLDGK